MFLAFILTYVFGREYIEGTAKNMLTLPVPRWLFVVAKLLVSSAWFLLLALWTLPLGFAAGSLAGLPGFDPAAFWKAAAKVMATSLLALGLGPLVAWVATATRGVFAPLGYALGTLIFATFLAHTGWGPWCPWSIVGLYSAAAGSGPPLVPGSYAVLAATFVLGLALTLRQEIAADNLQ